MRTGSPKPCQIARSKGGGDACRTLVTATVNSGATVSAGRIPTSRQMATRISTGTFIQKGGSWGVRGRSMGSPLKKTSCTNRSE